MTARHVAIVGGGLAGISAALECRRAGAAVTLLESRGRLGGAAFSFTREGMTADNGQHVFLRCCTAYRQLLDELEANHLVTLQDRLSIPVVAPGGRHATLTRLPAPAPLHLAATLSRYPFLSLAERASAARAMLALRRIDFEDPRVDERSFGEWLREHHQSPAAIDALWGLIVRPTINLVPDEASLAQVAQVFQVGLLRDASAGDIGYARAPLSEIHDVAARRALQSRGVDVRLRHGATTIVPLEAGFQIEISGAPTVSADVVILAVPPDRAARLLPSGSGITPGQLTGLGRSPIVNVHVVYDRPVMDEPFAAGVRTPVQYVFDRTDTAGLTSGQYLVVSLSAAEAELEMTGEELRGRYLPALAEVFPAASDAGVESFFVTREHSATFRAAPGVRALRPQARTALPGLILGGAWTDTGWPATMEGAVRSGLLAAHEALMAQVPEPSTELTTAVASVNGNGTGQNGHAVSRNGGRPLSVPVKGRS
ncbi:MAG TPA: hydroxysqualene dehydroxylase HpnE [Solirubrobacteraceae bacterium]|nr:hydroxysqualene dehydroxylase HpnE [Solirubrobacteraceae bacterium]